MLGLPYIPMALDMREGSIMQYLQCTKYQFVQHWHACCLRNLSILVNTSVFQTEKYNTAINTDKLRCCLTQF